MKSLPEHEFWKAVSSRLENYSDDNAPDDWERIAGAIPSRPSNAIRFSNAADVIVLIVMAFLCGYQVARSSGSETVTAEFLDPVTKTIELETASRRVKEKELVNDLAENANDTSDNVNHEAKPEQPTDASLTILNSHDIPGESLRNSFENEQSGIGKVSGDSEFDKNHKLQASSVEVDYGNKSTTSKHDRGLRNVEVSKQRSWEILLPERHEQEVSAAIEETHQDSSGTNTMTSETVVPLQNPGDVAVADKKMKDDSLPANGLKAKALFAASKTSDSQNQKKRKKFRPVVFAQLDPYIAYQKIVPSKDDNIVIVKLNSPGILSVDRFGISGSIGIQTQVLKSFEVYASINFYQHKTIISYDYLSEENPSIGSSENSLSFEIAPTSATNEITYSVRNTGISVGGLYRIKGSTLLHKIGGGIFYSAGIRKGIERASGGETKSGYGGYQLQYRVEYPMTPRTSFYIQPTFKRSIFSSEGTQEPFAVKPYWAGMSFGLIYRFE